MISRAHTTHDTNSHKHTVALNIASARSFHLDVGFYFRTIRKHISSLEWQAKRENRNKKTTTLRLTHTCAHYTVIHSLFSMKYDLIGKRSVEFIKFMPRFAFVIHIPSHVYYFLFPFRWLNFSPWLTFGCQNLTRIIHFLINCFFFFFTISISFTIKK